MPRGSHPGRAAGSSSSYDGSSVISGSQAVSHTNFRRGLSGVARTLLPPPPPLGNSLNDSNSQRVRSWLNAAEGSATRSPTPTIDQLTSSICLADDERGREKLSGESSTVVDANPFPRLDTAAALAKMQAMWSCEKAKLTSSVEALTATAEREKALRIEAEQQRTLANEERASLSTALAAFLAKEERYRVAVPLLLYEQARTTLRQYRDTLAEVETWQRRALTAAELGELLRDYRLPILGPLPPPWPPVSPLPEKAAVNHDALQLPPSSSSPPCTPLPHEVSVFASVSPETPSPLQEDSAGGRAMPHLFSAAIDTSELLQHHQQKSLSPLRSAEAAGAQPHQWEGPMHRFPYASLPARRAGEQTRRPKADRLSEMNELEKEEMIQETDLLVTELRRELVQLTQGQGPMTVREAAAFCRHRGIDYVDADFLPITASLGWGVHGCRGYDAVRCSTFMIQWCLWKTFMPPGRKPELLSSVGVDPSSLQCGRLGARGVVAGLAALAEAIGAVASIFASTTPDEEANGIYTVWLCEYGWWTRVILDAYLPCVSEPGRPLALYGCSSLQSYDLWAPLCEKALAKLSGSYRALQELTTDRVLGYLTGSPVECWPWWKRRASSALEEIEAAINTNERGAGCVLLTTFSEASLRDSASRTGASTQAGYRRLQLTPATTYRVLAVADDDAGSPMLLVRNWAKASLDAAEQQHLSNECGSKDVLHSPARDDGDESSCMWLSFHKEVVPLFDRCHVCFDCRRYHDVRSLVQFVGRSPAVPCHVFRVRVHFSTASEPARAEVPTRLWIGLHQPRGEGPLWGLKLSLVAQEVEPVLTTATGRVRPSCRSSLLSESYGGVSQTLPAVWMYLELHPEATQQRKGLGGMEDEREVARPLTFYVVPQLELPRPLSDKDDEAVDSRGQKRQTCRMEAASREMGPVETIFSGNPRTGAGTTPLTAVVAIMVEDKEKVEVDAVAAPEELRAALYHDVVDRVSFEDCTPLKGGRGRCRGAVLSGAPQAGSIRCQVNGRVTEDFTW